MATTQLESYLIGTSRYYYGTRELPDSTPFGDADNLTYEREDEGRAACLAFLLSLSPDAQSAELDVYGDPDDVVAMIRAHLEGNDGAALVLAKLREAYVDDHWQEYAERIALEAVRSMDEYLD